MKRSIFTTFSTVTLVALSTTILLNSNLPVIGQLAVPAIAQTAEQQQQAIKLNLSQSKKVGSKLVPISNSTSVKPGDIIVYTVTANNVSDRVITKLDINQKIKSGTVYESQSATPVPSAKLTFSVDGGGSFSAKPVLNKKPAAASTYTNVRWVFATVPPNSKSTVSYAVVVR